MFGKICMHTKMIHMYTTEALDEVAPIKTFNIRSHYRFGLSDKTKEAMHERDFSKLGFVELPQCLKNILTYRWKGT